MMPVDELGYLACGYHSLSVTIAASQEQLQLSSFIVWGRLLMHEFDARRSPRSPSARVFHMHRGELQ